MKQNRRNKVRLAIRRETAAARNTAHAQLTPAQKLTKLDERLGKGVGAVRERARLAKMIAKDVQPVSKEVAEGVFGTSETKAGKKAKKIKAA